MRLWSREAFLPALKRLDLQIHREVLRLRAQYQLSLDEFRGLYVSDKQVDALIRSANANNNANAQMTDIDDIKQRIEKMDKDAFSLLNKDTLWSSLCGQYDLSDIEQSILVMALAPELNAKYEVLYAYLNNDITRKYPTVELAMRLCNDDLRSDYRHALSKGEKLYDSGLLHEHTNSVVSYKLQMGFVLSPVVSDFLLNNSIDKALDNVLQSTEHKFVEWNKLPFNEASLQAFSGLDVVFRKQANLSNCLIESGKQSAAEFLILNKIKEKNVQAYKIKFDQGIYENDKRFVYLQQIAQILTLKNAALIIDFREELFSDEEKKKSIKALLDFVFSLKQPVFILLCSNDKNNDLVKNASLYTLVMKGLEAEERRKIWRYFLSEKKMDSTVYDVDQVADFFRLEFKQIETAVQHLSLEVLKQSSNREKLDDIKDKKILYRLAKSQSYSDISELAQKIDSLFGFSDLILPVEISNRIKEIIYAVRNRKLVYEDWGFEKRLGNAKGIMAMFSGSSGTGKTMAAGVISTELNLDLYRIDLSQVVSKYIGETEKNLDKIFSAAVHANCILFFDEADALFGKRSEVKDAHDRYANLEVAYLLQKMEEHDGIAILTTNLARNIDQAFSRRLQYIIEFPRPDQFHREKLWRGMFNEKAPLHDDVDFNFLARQFSNTGGDIKNIVLDAAMMAAETENKIIDMPLLLRASARQMVKQGKVPSASEFKHYFEIVSNVS